MSYAGVITHMDVVKLDGVAKSLGVSRWFVLPKSNCRSTSEVKSRASSTRSSSNVSQDILWIQQGKEATKTTKSELKTSSFFSCFLFRVATYDSFLLELIFSVTLF